MNTPKTILTQRPHWMSYEDYKALRMLQEKQLNKHLSGETFYPARVKEGKKWYKTKPYKQKENGFFQ